MNEAEDLRRRAEQARAAGDLKMAAVWDVLAATREINDKAREAEEAAARDMRLARQLFGKDVEVAG